MANSEPTRDGVSGENFRCTNCGYAVQVQSVRSLPRCPNCSGPQYWELLATRQQPRAA